MRPYGLAVVMDSIIFKASLSPSCFVPHFRHHSCANECPGGNGGKRGGRREKAHAGLESPREPRTLVLTGEA